MITTVCDCNLVSIPPDSMLEFDIHPGTRFEWAKADNPFVHFTNRAANL